MRALPLIGSLLVAFVAAGRARAELPCLVAQLAAGAARALPGVERAATTATVQRKAGSLGVTGAAVVPPPPKDVAAVTRVQGFAVRALQPRMSLTSPVVRAVKLTPMWPVGAYLTFEYSVTPRH